MVFQITPTTPSTQINAGENFTVDLTFNQPTGENLVDLILDIFYDSTELTLLDSSITFPGITGAVTPNRSDDSDTDGDPETDTFLSVQWGPNLPTFSPLNFTPPTLMTLELEALSTFDGANINLGTTNSGATVVNADNLVMELGDTTPPPPSSTLDDPLFRFQNSDLPGTYLFAGEGESENIRANFPNFVEEGLAFNVSFEEGDDLVRFNRFQNSNVPGSYLYATEGESESIRANFPNFIEEGVAFYAYGADANQGVDYYRFQNTQQPGTYIFVGEAERQSILANFPNFIEEGIAFEVAI